MTKVEVMERIKAERARWNELVARVDDDRMLQPVSEGGRSGKDVVAHVIWYEREMVEMLKSRALVGSELWALPVHERNAGLHKEIKDLTLDQVRAWNEKIFPELIDQLERLPKQAYLSAAYFDRMPSEWAPWQVIAGNTFEHYPQHGPAIRRLNRGG